MRTEVVVATAVLALCASSSGVASERLVDRWTAPVYQVPLSSERDRSVWGPGASRRREVNLALEPSGDGVLTVRTEVVDASGRTKAGSLLIEEARLRVTMPKEPAEDRIELSVAVLSAERRYPDDPRDRWPIEGLVVKLSTVASDPGRINLQFDTPEGRGSFGESLIRQSPGAVTQATR